MRAKLDLIEGTKVKLSSDGNKLSVVSFSEKPDTFLKKTIGILGGMGPEASAELYSKIIKLCQKKYNAKLDEDYPPMIIYNLPAPQMIDDLRNKDKLFFALIDGVKKLENAGADFIVIACNTVHYFLPDLQKNVSIPILSIIEEVAGLLVKNKIKKIGLLATITTIKQKIYENRLREFGISIIVPDEQSQRKVLSIIRKTIAGKSTERDRLFLKSLIEKLKSKGAQAIVLGCTELPLVISQKDSPIPLVDTLQILAEAAVKNSKQ